MRDDTPTRRARDVIDSVPPGVELEALRRRLRARIDELRERPAGHVPLDPLTLRSTVFVDSLDNAIGIADRKSQIRTQWPSNLGSRWPFSLAPVRRTSLALLAFLFKDQRHVNVALVAALRNQITLNRHLIEELASLRADVQALRSIVGGSQR